MKSNKTLILLTLTFTLIVFLQGYSALVRYQNEKKFFEEKVNLAIHKSIENVHKNRNEEVINDLKQAILSDSISSFQINWNNNHKTYMISLVDKIKTPTGQNNVSFSKSNFSTKYDSITPSIKEKILDECLKDVSEEMQKGYVWYYTQAVGNFLDQEYFQKPITIKEFFKELDQELLKLNIQSSYQLKPSSKNDLSSQHFKIQIKENNNPELYNLYFPDPFWDLFKQQIVPILGSLILMILAFISFSSIYKSLNTHQKLNAQKDLLVTNITHELKTPIAAIQASSEALQQFDWNENQRQSFLNIINQQTQKLDDLCNEMLDQIRLSKAEIKIENINLKQLINEVSNTFTDLEITNLVDNSFEILSDKKILTKAFNNFLDNASKYNNSEIKKCVVSTQTKNSILEIIFCDNGIGISKENQNLIFEKFFRISNTEIHNQKGYGIGLSYTKDALENIGAKISVDSKIGQGSIFTIQIPL